LTKIVVIVEQEFLRSELDARRIGESVLHGRDDYGRPQAAFRNDFFYPRLFTKIDGSIRHARISRRRRVIV